MRYFGEGLVAHHVPGLDCSPDEVDVFAVTERFVEAAQLFERRTAYGQSGGWNV